MQRESASRRDAGQGPTSPVFVVGPSRSGTTLMMSALRLHPSLHITGETHYFDDLRPAMAGHHRTTLTEEQRRRCEDYFLRIAHRGYGKGGDPDAGPMRRTDLRAAADEVGTGTDAYFEGFCRLQAAGHGAQRWGEKTPRHIFRIDDMLICYPSARVVCMIRDPRAVVASYRDMVARDRPVAGAAAADAADGVGPAVDAGPLDDAVARARERKRRSYDVLVASLMWRGVARRAVDALAGRDRDRIRLVRYEDLAADPGTTLRALCAWLGEDFEPSMLDVTVRNSTYMATHSATGVARGSVDRWRQRLSPDEVAIIQSACARPMRALGYTVEPVPPARRHVAAAWARLPATAGRAALANRTRSGRLIPYVWRRVRAVARPAGVR